MRDNPIWNFETREAGLLMDVDKDILLAQCLRNSVRLVYRFEIDCVRQYRGQRSFSAKLLNFLIFYAMHDYKLINKADLVKF